MLNFNKTDTQLPKTNNSKTKSINQSNCTFMILISTFYNCPRPQINVHPQNLFIKQPNTKKIQTFQNPIPQKQNKLKIWKKNLELLNKENRRRMRLKRIIELESSIEEANGSIIKTSYHFTPSTRTTLDFLLLLFLFHVVVILFFFLWNCAFCNVLLLEEFELPPLIHRRRDSQSIDRNRNRNSNQKCEGFFKLSRELNLQRDRSRCDEWRSHWKKLPAAKRQFRLCLQMPYFLACSLKLIS